MSRVGKQAINIPSGISVVLMDRTIKITKGNTTETYVVPAGLNANVSEHCIVFTPANTIRSCRAIWGTTQRNVSNIICGMNKDFSITLKLSGVGYKATVNGKRLLLQLGYSHDIDYDVPEDVTILCPDVTTIVVSGKSKKRVGDVAAEIKTYRKPEPYKGKGVIRQGEFVYRKEGKKK